MRKKTALVTAGVLLAAPLATATAAAPAHADTSKRGACGSGTYEFQVDREDAEDGGGFEVGAELDRVAPGSRWTVVLRHDGTRVAKVTRTADAEGDLDVEVRRADTAGRDVFRFRARPAGGGPACTASITR